MWAEFKEKTFETAFVGELRLLTNVIYAPDQCDENLLGFDGSAFLPWEYMPPFLPFLRHRRWRHLVGITAGEISEFGKELNNRLPKFRLNLFIQFKRPQYLTRPSAKEWEHWEQEYFRYAVEENQQQLLRNIIDVGRGRAVAVYAVPAFYKSDELYSHQIENEIIKNTNVLSAAFLSGHTQCTFIEAGNFGKGHSEPEEIESPTLEDLIQANLKTEELSFTQHVKSSAEFIKEALSDDTDGRNTLDLARRAILGGELSDVYPRAAGSWLDAALTMTAFASAFGVRVCAIGDLLVHPQQS